MALAPLLTETPPWGGGASCAAAPARVGEMAPVLAPAPAWRVPPQVRLARQQGAPTAQRQPPPRSGLGALVRLAAAALHDSGGEGRGRGAPALAPPLALEGSHGGDWAWAGSRSALIRDAQGRQRCPPQPLAMVRVPRPPPPTVDGARLDWPQMELHACSIDSVYLVSPLGDPGGGAILPNQRA